MITEILDLFLEKTSQHQLQLFKAYITFHRQEKFSLFQKPSSGEGDGSADNAFAACQREDQSSDPQHSRKRGSEVWLAKLAESANSGLNGGALPQ